MVQDLDNLIWVDLEMSGLDVASRTILEMAVVITDKDLNELDRWPVTPPGQKMQGQAIYHPESVLQNMDEWVRQNLPELLERVRQSSVVLGAAEEMVLDLVRQYCPDPGQNRKEGCPLAGNSIGQDRAFLRVYMPNFEQYTSYRNVDVSTIKELVKRWFPDYRYKKREEDKHNAMRDILASIEELRHYRLRVFGS